MKPQIHPDYHFVTIEMTDGTTYKTRTTWGSEGETMKLLIDPTSHPAYTGKRRVMDQAGRIDRFNARYGRKADS